MAASSTGSKLILLPDLRLGRVGDKVRFLGCVEQYDTKSACLMLSYSYQSSHKQAGKYIAIVEISHALEDARSFILQIGTWLNVIGFVMETPAKDESRMRLAFPDMKAKASGVQAIMIWEAEQIKLDEYERAVRMRSRPD